MSSESIIMSLRELIDTAFGEFDKNTVNFNLVKTIMYILARQLRLLERQVEVQSRHGVKDKSVTRKSSSLSVTEVKIQAKVHPKKNKVAGKSSASGSDTTKIKDMSSKGEKKAYKKSLDTGEKQSTQGEIYEFETSFEESEMSSGDTSDQDKLDKSVKSSDRDKDKLSDKSGERKKDKRRSEKSNKSGEKKIDSKSEKHRNAKKVTEKDKKPTDTKIYQKMNAEEDEIAKKERLLRIINQRSDSREEGRHTPTPMASPVVSEKILVVQTKAQEKRDKRNTVSPKVSVVTQQQFAELAQQVEHLRNKHFPDASDVSESKVLMKDLKKKASLTSSLVALQLSHRLDAAEKTLEKMIARVTYLYQILSEQIMDDELEREKSITTADYETTKPQPAIEDSSINRRMTLIDSTRATVDRITYAELDQILQELTLNIEKNMELQVEKTKATTDNALRICKELDVKLSEIIHVELRMGELEHLVDQYTQKINILDTSLSSQMTHYQELLTQMQHDLEAGIENMAEALANAGGDTSVIKELNTHFSSLAMDFDNMAIAQRELRDNEHLFTLDLQELWKQVEYLKAVKADRDEVEDALRDKAGLDSLNGLTTMMQFEAVRGDLEKRICSAYDKFNSQELIWQRAIDNVIRELNEKSHHIQLESLRDEIAKHLNLIRDRLEFIANIVGEPHAIATTRMITRNMKCVSCTLPAHMKVEQPTGPIFRPLPTFKKIPTPKIAEGAGDHEPCIPGQPLPHPVDIRAKICNRYCGGEHTKVKANLQKLLKIAHVARKSSLETGADGQQYKVEPAEIPCLPCNYYPEEQIKEPCTCGDVCKCYLATEKKKEKRLDTEEERKDEEKDHNIDAKSEENSLEADTKNEEMDVEIQTKSEGMELEVTTLRKEN